MNGIDPIGPILAYLEQYSDDRAAGRDEWEVFWDYKWAVEADGGSIFAEPTVFEASARLISYLFFYGMGRGSTRLLTVGSSKRFASVLDALSTPHAQELFQEQFHVVDWSAMPFTVVWNDLENALHQVDVSATSTMRSKILLAVWGQMPALDTRFYRTFTATWDFWAVQPFPGNVLNAIRQRYLEAWRHEIDEAPDDWKHTTGGNRIPDARLIDIAFWYHGQ